MSEPQNTNTATADTHAHESAPEAPAAAAAEAPATRRGRGQRPRGDRRNQRTEAAQRSGQTERAERPVRTHPVLETLAGLYPALFGANFLPLKRGIFHDLVAAHPQAFAADDLKVALGLHTRSSRYLAAVAAGLPRHDLAGRVVEPMAPEHVYQALVEVFRRRQGRTPEDLGPKLRRRIVQAFDASGLSREAYAQLVRVRDETANAALDQCMAELAARAARDEALLRAFESGGQTLEDFAGMYGLVPADAAQSLERARRSAALAAAAQAAAQTVPHAEPQGAEADAAAS